MSNIIENIKKAINQLESLSLDQLDEDSIMISDKDRDAIELIKQAGGHYELPVYGKIGIGLTTHNRIETFRNTIQYIIKYAPEGCRICVVDDASVVPADETAPFDGIQYFRFDTNVGIARAKNKALELLYNAGCEHFFLFDDDTYALVDNWWKPYVESREPHLMYIFESFANAPGPNDMIKIYEDNEISAYSHVRGCMLYYKRVVLDTVGGMDTVYGKWGNEHGDLSNRIYSAGLTRFRYMDVANSKGLFYAADEQEHGKFVSTVPGAQRIDLLNKTKAIYDLQYNVGEYREFRSEMKQESARINKLPLLLTSYFTTLPDTQRGGQKWDFEPVILTPYLASIEQVAGESVRTVVLNDVVERESFCPGQWWERVSVSVNPYFQRWMSYYEYLIRNRSGISWVFMTDCTDVELLRMPNPERGKVYVGDEPDMIGNSQWLKNHHKDPELQQFFISHRNMQMVNAGILGGYIEDVLPFIRAIIDTYTRMMHNQRRKKTPGPGITDMGIFNYVAYTQFRQVMIHGPQVNTRFKANERNNIAMFKHK